MDRVILIEHQLSDIDSQIESLKRNKDALEKEIKIIREQHLHQEIERWKLEEGACYWMFDKENDSVYSTLHGYQILKIHDNQLCRLICTTYSIEAEDSPRLELREMTCSLQSFRNHREENDVYIVSPSRYRELQTRLLSFDIDSYMLLKEFESEISEYQDTHQVE